MTKLIKQLKNSNKAFTLFVSLIVAAFLLAVGFSIGNILIKQLTLASSGSGSQIAFYAADSAAECALFWDRKNNLGISVVEGPFSITARDAGRLICGSGLDNELGEGFVYAFKKVCDDINCGETAAHATSTFYVDTSNPRDPESKSCAFVTVSKDYDPVTGLEKTAIDAKGYNTDLIVGNTQGSYTFTYQNPDANCNLSRPKTVERALFVSY